MTDHSCRARSARRGGGRAPDRGDDGRVRQGSAWESYDGALAVDGARRIESLRLTDVHQVRAPAVGLEAPPARRDVRTAGGAVAGQDGSLLRHDVRRRWERQALKSRRTDRPIGRQPTVAAVLLSTTSAAAWLSRPPRVTVVQYRPRRPWDMAFLPDGSMLYTERDAQALTLREPDGDDRTSSTARPACGRPARPG